MHLIEYDLDENDNIDDYPSRKLLWETLLGRNSFCQHVKLLGYVLNKHGDFTVSEDTSGYV